MYLMTSKYKHDLIHKKPATLPYKRGYPYTTGNLPREKGSAALTQDYDAGCLLTSSSADHSVSHHRRINLHRQGRITTK